MGHCDTSTQLSRHRGFFGTAGGAVETAAGARVADVRSIARAASRVTPPQFSADLDAAAAAQPDRVRRAKTFGAWWLLASVRFYKIFFSPFLGGACKFYPSCSSYAQEAIELHGARRGAWLALQRLGRCRPFTKGGFDPVPDVEDSDAAWLRSDARCDGGMQRKERAQ
jgi:putative membrane protein insertion efficiency factor